MIDTTEARIVWMYANQAIASLRGGRLRDERGEIAQTVIIVAILAAAAVAIATIIATKFKEKANGISTE